MNDPIVEALTEAFFRAIRDADQRNRPVEFLIRVPMLRAMTVRVG